MSDLAALDAALNQLESKLKAPQPFYAAIAAHLEAVAERSFATESAPAGNRWKPLSRTTIALRRAMGYPASPILTMTGALRRSIESKVEEQGGADSGIADVVVGSKVEYASKHQQGRGKRPPKRPFLGVAPDTPGAVRDALTRLLGQ